MLDVAADACFVINFLAVDRGDVLGGLSSYRFHIPLEVLAEVTQRTQRARLEVLIAAQVIDVVEITDIAEVALYTELRQERIGSGEAACLTLAISRGWRVASDERGRFARVEGERTGDRPMLTTLGAMVEAVESGLLSVEEALKMRDELEADHRFRMTLPQNLAAGVHESADDGGEISADPAPVIEGQEGSSVQTLPDEARR